MRRSVTSTRLPANLARVGYRSRTVTASNVPSISSTKRELSSTASSRSTISQATLKPWTIQQRAYATESSASVLGHTRKPHFDKILIANRGEIACRVIRTAKKLGIKTVAVFSEVDKNSLHVKMVCDTTFLLGMSLTECKRPTKLIRKASANQRLRYGFLSENATFSEQLAAEGIVFIGPPASAIVSMGSKSESKNIMSGAGVPCVPGYHGDNQDPGFLFNEAKHIGFPVLIKAIHGGGGKGMRTVSTPTAEAFNEALLSAKRESLKAFGNDTVLVEKYIERPRHVEVQVFADTHGEVVSLWERDCSVQRRNQKIIEEAPAPGLTPELRADLSAKAVAAAKAVNYVGAGTVEFIFDNDTQDFYFMEMNTRLQVEHPVTEMVTGLDLVEWQLEVAAGNALPLAQAAIPLVGHAFEARIYAENPRNNFLPDSGSLLHLSTPTPTHIFAPPFPPAAVSPSAPIMSFLTPSQPSTSVSPSLRIEQGFEQGAQIGVFYDPMIAKVVVHGRDRTEALRILRKALDEYHVVGVSTNVEFLRMLAGNQSFIDQEVETGFIPEPTHELLAQAGLFASPWSTLTSRRFGGDKYERIIVLQSESSLDNPVTVRVASTTAEHFDISVQTAEGESHFHSVQAKLLSPTVLSSTLTTNYSHTTIWRAQDYLGATFPKWLLSLGSDMINAHKGALKAPMPSVVVELRVKLGDKVEKGQAVVILESMKTETVLRAETAGVVKAVGCKNGEMVEEGRELIDIEEETSSST
ncbi:carbamoyl-phosphate synthase L chain, ATP binding domain-containing protein [Cyathus striatus]|nr:carbamoyl-phosphate synthase L chain, ATP binding domain-containing protein [Cyathus striatus]